MNITDEDYRIKGYFKKKGYDSKGDIVTVGYYAEYDEAEPVEEDRYKKLKVRETRTVERDVGLGIPFKLTVDIEWLSSDEVSVRATKQLIKWINSYDGMAMNTASRTRLVETAQGYLLGEVGLADTQEFGTDVALERSAYISGTRQSLIDAINNSSRTYMTPTIKATLVAILDIAY